MAGLRIFISHSSKDAGWCTEFAEALKGAGADVWYDQQGLYVGDQWVAVLEKEIQRREVFLLVLTPDSWVSEWVQKELRLALGQHKRIVGVIHKAAEVSGFITTYQLLDVVGQSAQQAAAKVAPSVRLAPSLANPAGQRPRTVLDLAIEGRWSAVWTSRAGGAVNFNLNIFQRGDELAGYTEWGYLDLFSDDDIDTPTEGLRGTIRGHTVLISTDSWDFSLTLVSATSLRGTYMYKYDTDIIGKGDVTFGRQQDSKDA